MTGLLHRLSERAVHGTRPRVRPLAPTQWLIAPQPLVPAAEFTPQTSAVPGDSGISATTTAQPDQQALAAPAQHRPDRPPSRTIPDPAPPRDGANAASAANAAPEPMPAFTFEVLVPDTVAPPAPTPSPDLAPAPAPIVRTPAASPYEPTPAWSLPAPLLAVPAVASPMAVEYRGMPPAARTVPPGEPTTEVHVRISRVELTALVEPAAPQPKSRPEPAARSLEEYLDQRKARL